MSTLRNIKLLSGCFAGCLMVWNMYAGAVDQAFTTDPALHEIRPRWITPHLEWGKPLARGKLKVFFLVPESLGGREVIELWERFDMDYEGTTVSLPGLITRAEKGATYYCMFYERHKGVTLKERIDDIVSRLSRKYDVIVLGNVAFTTLPGEAQYLVLKQVAEGTGLVITYGHQAPKDLFSKPVDDDRDLILSGIPFAGLPYYTDGNQSAFEKHVEEWNVKNEPGIGLTSTNTPFYRKTAAELHKALVKTFAYGKGRIVVLDYLRGRNCIYLGLSLFPAEAVSIDGWRHRIEYHASLVARAILWAAGRKEGKWIKLPPEPVCIERNDLPAVVNAALALPEAWDRLAVEVSFRDRYGNLEDTLTRNMRPVDGQIDVPVNIPKLKIGKHFCDLVVSSPQGKVQWASFTVDVQSEAGIAGVMPDAFAYSYGGNITGTIKLKGPPLEAGGVLRVGLSDYYGRLVASEDIRIEKERQTYPFCLSSVGAKSIPVMVDVEWLVDGKTIAVDRAKAILTGVPNWKYPCVTFGALGTYDGSDQIVSQMGKEQFQNMGVTHVLAHPNHETWQIPMNNFERINYICRITGDISSNDVTSVRKGAVVSKSMGTRIFSLGDENGFSYSISTNECERALFGEYLKTQYKSLKELNREWNADFRDWHEATAPGDVKEMTAKKQHARRYDQFAFKEYRYASAHHELAKAIREIIPGAVVGAEGSQPGDIELTIDKLDLWSPYGGNNFLSLIQGRSFFPYGGWWGGYSSAYYPPYPALWPQMLSGSVNANYVYPPTGLEGLGIMSCDLSFADFWENYMDDLHEIQGGLGQLFAAGELLSEEIAVYYSQRAHHAGGIGANPFGGPGNEIQQLTKKCRTLGITPFMLTNRMIEKGKLDEKRFKIIFLANAARLSDKELDALERFVQKGGILVSDAGVGLCDEHCKPGRQSRCENFFGFTRENDPKPETTNAVFRLNIGRKSLNISSSETRLDASIRPLPSIPPDNLRLTGNQCLAILRETGKGKVLLINGSFSLIDLTSDNALPGLVEQLLAVAGVERRAWEEGDERPEFYLYALGDRQLMGVVRPERRLDTVIQLAQSNHVWNLRSGEYLGNVNRIPLSKHEPRFMAFGFSPYPAPSIKIDTARSIRPGAVLPVTVKQSGAPGGYYGLLRMDLFSPSGRQVEAYTDILRVKGDRIETSIPFALNDETGEWKIKVKDMFTGVTITNLLSVK